MHILVVAAGSAGRRHARNLATAVGARISCVDPREERLQQAKAEVPDLYGRPHERSVTVAGDDGTLQALFDPPRVQVAKDAAGTWDTTVLACERNDMFVAEAREFAELVRGALPRARCTLDDGVAVMRCIEAIRLSHARRAVQSLTGPAARR